ncbi:MAG: VCBS repeat-containing protein [Polyangiaceae bacterium]
MSPDSVDYMARFVVATAALVHVNAKNERVMGETYAFTLGAYTADFPSVAAPFDFDGDGQDEVVVGTTRDAPFAHDETGVVLTLDGGRVVPFGPAKAIDVHQVEDVDGDGRPDLMTLAPFRGPTTQSCGDMQMSESLDAPLLAHSLPDGTFSFTDDVALSFDRRGCERAPPTPLVIAGNSPDGPLTVRCARLHGQTAAAVRAAIRKVCTSQSKGCVDPKQPTACTQYDLMIAWADAEPPVVLSAAISKKGP